MTTVAMVALLFVAILTIPVSIPVSKKIGKRGAYQIGFGVLAASCLAIFVAGHAMGIRITSYNVCYTKLLRTVP